MEKQILSRKKKPPVQDGSSCPHSPTMNHSSPASLLRPFHSPARPLSFPSPQSGGQITFVIPSAVIALSPSNVFCPFSGSFNCLRPSPLLSENELKLQQLRLINGAPKFREVKAEVQTQMSDSRWSVAESLFLPPPSFLPSPLPHLEDQRPSTVSGRPSWPGRCWPE